MMMLRLMYSFFYKLFPDQQQQKKSRSITKKKSMKHDTPSPDGCDTFWLLFPLLAQMDLNENCGK